MDTLAQLAPVGTLIVAVLGILTFWMTLGSRITKSEEKAEGASRSAVGAIAKAELVSQQVTDLRAAHGERIAAIHATVDATTKSLTAAELRLATAIDTIGRQMDHLSDTIIKALTDIAGGRLQK